MTKKTKQNAAVQEKGTKKSLKNVPKELDLTNAKVIQCGSYRQNQDFSIEFENNSPIKVFLLIQGYEVTGEDEIFANILFENSDDEIIEDSCFEGSPNIENCLNALNQLLSATQYEQVLKILKNENLYEREEQTIENNEIIQILSDCYKNNERLAGSIKKKEYDYFDQGSWNFNIKILSIKKTKVSILYNAIKLTPSRLWDNGIEKSKKINTDIAHLDTIEEFLKNIIQNAQGSGYCINSWKIK